MGQESVNICSSLPGRKILVLKCRTIRDPSCPTAIPSSPAVVLSLRLDLILKYHYVRQLGIAVVQLRLPPVRHFSFQFLKVETILSSV